MSDVIRFEDGGAAFQAIATYLAAFQGFVTAVEVYNNEERMAKPWSTEDNAIFDGYACDSRLSWRPYEVINCLTKGK